MISAMVSPLAVEADDAAEIMLFDLASPRHHLNEQEELAMQAIASLVGRVMIATIFLLSAVGNKIPNFNDLAGHMSAEGVPIPHVMLAGAIVFLIVGSLSVIVGYKIRIGAALLLAFLVLATYFFHDFWTLEDAQAKQAQLIQFMKNLSMMGTMVFLMANGAGALSFDNSFANSKMRTGKDQA